MRHECDLYSVEGVEEFLFYYDEAFVKQKGTIQMLPTGTASALTGTFEWQFAERSGVSFSLDGFGGRVELEAWAQARLPGADRWSLGPVPIVGRWKVDGVEVGTCTLCDDLDFPLLELKSKVWACNVAVLRSERAYHGCPLLVVGFENCEMVLQDYYQMTKARRKALPDAPKRARFIGSCRISRFIAPERRPKLEMLGIVTVISELVLNRIFLHDSG